MATPEWWQTMLSTAAGGSLAFAGQWVSSRRQAKTLETVRVHARTEAVYDRRLTYELERLEELRQALLEAEDAAEDGRRYRRAQHVGAFGTPPATVMLDRMVKGPIDLDKALRFAPAMLTLRSALAVTVDDEVRRAGQAAYANLEAGDRDSRSYVGAAVDTMGRRLRTIQGKV